ncbi:glycosyltransferase [Flavobacteriaceae bacterium R38]|nr:glycosyltransferase [Flavobacteriaceae bacterium R38]
MRIGIEAQRLFRPHKHGMDRVALELIRNLQLIDQENEYFIFVKPDEDNDVITNSHNFNIVEIPGSPYPVWEQLKLPKFVQKYNCDILHCTSNTAPLKLRVPLITTLHDIIFKESSIIKQLTSSASWYQKIGNLYRRLIVEKVIKSSSRLITVSNFEKKNITNFFKVKDENLKAIHNGVTDRFTNNISDQQKAEIKKKYGLPEQFLLHIGNTDPRKNTQRVIEAFHLYANKNPDGSKLVLIGINQTKLHSILSELNLLNELENKIVLTGYVADEDLPVIFNMAQIFLFPSLREGFGIPIIEAMACGTPVITSKTSSMPEVAGDAALLVDPYKTEDIYNGITKITSDTHLKNELINKGLEHYKLFSWKNTAHDVLALYKQLYNEQKTRNHD